MTNIGFEGLAGPHEFVTVPDDYFGLDWTNAGALDKQLIRDVYPHGGYGNTIHKKGVVYLYGDDGNTGNAGFALADGTFSLKSGTFASAWNAGDQVTFTALKDGVVMGTKFAVLDETATELAFDNHFHHIDEVQITWTPGTTVDPSEGSGPYLAVDDLKIVFDDAPVPAHEAFDSAHPFGIVHPSEWMLV